MTQSDLPRIVPAGDTALLLVFAEEISPEVNARVRALAQAVERRGHPGIRETVSAFSSLLVFYDPLAASFEEIRDLLLEEVRSGLDLSDRESRLREIPSVFGGAYGPDLPSVARHLQMGEEEFLRRYLDVTYTVYMLGFAPGNPYLGGLPPELAMPRLESPRERVPAGTVAIANQACIYSLTSPGGWRWLGRTPIKLFDPTADPPVHLQEGDRVRFIPISEEEYLGMGGERATCP